MNKVKCPNCSYTEVLLGSSFCNKCGSSMNSRGESPPHPSGSIPSEYQSSMTNVKTGQINPIVPVMMPISYSSKSDDDVATGDDLPPGEASFKSVDMVDETTTNENIPPNPPPSTGNYGDEIDVSADFPQSTDDGNIKEISDDENEDDEEDEGKRKYKYPLGFMWPKWSCFWWVLWVVMWIIFIAQGIGACYLHYQIVLKDIFNPDNPMPIFSVGQVSRGWISIGQFAKGFICIGQMTFCVIALGQVNLSICGCGQVGMGFLFFIGQAGLSCGISGGQIVPGIYVLFSMLSLGCWNNKSLVGFNLVKPFVRCGYKEPDDLLRISPITSCIKGKKKKLTARTRSDINSGDSGGVDV